MKKNKINHPRVSILGVQVNALAMPSTLQIFANYISNRQSAYVCVVPAHSVMECVQNPSLYPAFNNSNLTTPDGMAIVWLMRLKGHKSVQRVYGPDLLISACEFGISRDWRHYFLGGTDQTLAMLTAKLQTTYPDLKIVGHYAPPFRPLSPEENEQIIASIRNSQADIVWIGLGSPRQEIWMHENFSKTDSSVMIGIGAAFDFLSGSKPQSPRWLQKLGMEWFFRLVSEPKRLWPRYRQYPRFVWLVIRELLRKE
jgi:N-acetylglucosaminyldiphosphoundecaprenol N-acetyl-beta-D-mannosaminyltransferase